jgi:ribosomal protein S6
MENNREMAETKVYELGIVLVSSIPEEKVGDEVTRIKDILTKHNASIIAEETPKLRKLAYTMVKKIAAVNKRFENGYFGWVKFDATPDQATAIKKEVQENDNVLRLILITTIRDNTLLSSKLNLGEEGEDDKKEDKPAVAAEDLDKSIDKTVEELAV